MDVFSECQYFLKFAKQELELQNESNLLSFLRGYFAAKSKDSKFVDYLSIYLWREFEINGQFNSWEEQIDHYAFVYGYSWYNAFFRIVHDIWTKKNIYEIRIEETDRNSENINVHEKLLDIINTDKYNIRVGDFLCLRDKIHDDYKKTKFYNAKLQVPSWDLFYPSK